MSKSFIVFEHNGSDILYYGWDELPKEEIIPALEWISKEKECDVSEITMRISNDEPSPFDLLETREDYP